MTRSQPTRACPHCGRALDPVYAPAFMGSPRSVVGWRPCRCEGALREREEREERERERKAAEEAERRRRAYARAGIRPRFADAEHPLASRILDGAGRGRGAYVHGPVGTGKTHLASAAARMAVDSGMRVRVTDMAGVASLVRGSFGSRGGEDDSLRPLLACDLLVVDDLGKEPPTDWALSQAFRVVNGRYEAALPIVVTSQYGLRELGGRLSRNGDVDTALAIVSRLAGMCDRYQTGGPDRRLGDG